jgi:predicted metal-binding protein
MRRWPSTPALHLFVCTNRRDDASPLGPGCGAHGEDVYAAMKDEVARRRLFASVWVTATHCLGVCPKHGATVAVYPAQAIYSDVEVADVASLLP